MNFDDMRPYRDKKEVKDALERLLNTDQVISFVSRLAFKGVPRSRRKDTVYSVLRQEFKDVSSVEDFQHKLGRYVREVIDKITDSATGKTTARVSISGLENITKNDSYLFISNHRNIVLDFMLINYVLHSNGYRTAQIAIGDNLLSLDWVNDFFRLNKAFIVKRGRSGKENYGVSLLLSQYIEKQRKDRESVCIAQQEGRAKDGNDETSPTVIKMFYLSPKERARSEGKEPIPFSDYINQLNIVTVSISSEYNPCDRLMAKELHKRRLNGSYTKSRWEDEKSMLMGIKGESGRIHISFGTPLRGDFSGNLIEAAKKVASEIDKQIIMNYMLWETNYTAFYELKKIDSGRKKDEKFLERVMRAPEELRPIILEMYANPLINRSRLEKLNA
jgi:hypothetical protein